MAQMTADEKKWKITNAVDTLQRAEAIKRDRPLMNQVKREVKKQQTDLQKIVKPAAKPRPAARRSSGGRGKRR